MNLRRAAGLMLALSMSGCVSVGPITRSDAAQVISRDAGLSKGESVQVFSRAYWYPGVYGFKGLWSGMGQGPASTGVLVCTNTRLLLLVWDDEREIYVATWRLDRKHLAETQVKTMGNAARLVLTSKFPSVDSFEVTGPGGAFIDHEKTAEFAKCATPVEPDPQEEKE